jgi:divalent metal cation (Fe/Co/Zn/Cd) transporter
MSNFAQPTPLEVVCAHPGKHRTTVYWLQGVTLAWMLVECGVALYASVQAHSPALLAFGSDSVVELLSASVVLLQFLPGAAISERTASRAAGILLYVLAVVVCGIAATSLALKIHPEVSCTGIGITLAALLVMPILARLKRREGRRIGNAALAADAVQSATCAYLALVTLVGLAINAVFHLAWFDCVAALAAVPLLLREGKQAWQGQSCCCH